jgi:hypothetical protein
METEATSYETASGAAVDAEPSRRPGVPQSASPAPVGDAHWTVPDAQDIDERLTKDAQREAWTATFGTGQPPRALSGLMRRSAYRIPDYRVRRWLLLMAADRVDTLEWQTSRALRSPWVWLGMAGVSLGVLLARSRRGSK